ncbi:MAG: hypothetical protein RIR18_2461 [Pseudomonadota bacterium]|jgi:predicted transcriptional regulator
MTEQDKRRRNSLLCTLAYHGGNSVARVLRTELEEVHGVAVTLDKVRADLRVLADIGALRYEDDGDLVQITAEGREHAQQLRKLF